MSKLTLKDIFCDVKVYLCSVIRLVVMPTITLYIFLLITNIISGSNLNTANIINIILIAACTPVGANIAVFAKKYQEDYLLSVKLVCLSTIMSVVTIPVFMGIAGKFI